MILIDTSVLIKFLEKQEEIVNFVTAIKEELYISAITIAEVAVGYFWQPKDKRETSFIVLNELIEERKITLLPVDAVIGFKYGEIQAALRKQGTLISPFDGIIAATSIVHDLTLLTTDRDFRRVKGIKLLFPSASDKKYK